MNMLDVIAKKKNKGILSRDEIDYFVKGYTLGSIPDYQVSALLMAICLNEMDDGETRMLTEAMMHSGDVLDLSAIKGIKYDKHSTGGVGDKTTLVLAPMLAACGLKIAKMSGRGLGFTGGTIDKLESIAGFKTALDNTRFIAQVNSIGLAVASQTHNIAPADKKLYALRDVTATVDNTALIASSILSKKLACGADAIVLDVKCGSGAFMKTRSEAETLAEKMIKIGRDMGKIMCAVISDMSRPLGHAVGNALEVNEAVETLRGGGPEDLKELCLTLGAVVMYAGGEAKTEDEAKRRLELTLINGAAYRKFLEFVAAQGGDPHIFDEGKSLMINSDAYPVKSRRSGYICRTDCEQVGMASLLSGAGRETKDAAVDSSAGLVIHKKPGDRVEKGETIAQVYASDKEKAAAASQRLRAAYTFSDVKPVQKNEIILKIMR